MELYETSHGLDKPTTYFMIGGDFWYQKFHGAIRDLRFYSEHAIEATQIMCS